MRRRVVITGIGVVAPGGIGVKDFWSLLSEGRTATRGITFFDPSPFRSRVAAEVDFEPEAHGLSPQEIRRMDRAAQFAVVTAAEAMADSGHGAVGPGPVPDRSDGRQRGGRHDEAGRRSTASSATAAGWTWSTTTYAVPHLYDYLVPSSFAGEVAWSVGGRGASHGGFDRLHVRPGLGRLRDRT